MTAPIDDMEIEYFGSPDVVHDVEYIGDEGGVYDLEVVELSSSANDGSEIIFGEIPYGLINGSNATFTSLFDFIPEKLIVERNGITQRRGIDYITTGNRTIDLTFSPEESILINYIKL